MAIDAATVKKVASLAKLRVEEERLGLLAEELSGILAWIEQLNAVDTEGVEPMASAVAAKLPMREDVVTDGGDPQAILAAAAKTLDFSRPVAVMLIAIMHLIGDQDDPGGIIKQLMAAVPAGSYLALSQVASDIEAEQMAEAARRYNRLARETQRHRSHAEVTRFFDGLELLDPGVVPVPRWRPASKIEADAHSAMWGGVALKR